MTSLAKDICNQRSYRSRRRREIFRLQKTVQDMEKKINFLETQVDFYDQYLKQCLANLHAAKKKRVHFRTSNHLVKIISLFNELIIVELCYKFTEKCFFFLFLDFDWTTVNEKRNSAILCIKITPKRNFTINWRPSWKSVQECSFWNCSD